MKYKKILFMVSVFSIVLCVGCEKESNNNLDNKAKDYIMDNPIITEDDYWGEGMFPDIEIETTGENLSASIEKEEYSTSDKSISVILESCKKGVGFYFYGIPAIERLEGEQWVRLAYRQSDPSREQWCICAIEDVPDTNFSTKLSVDIDNISDELTEGQYRVVVFLTDRSLYVPFNVTGG